MSSYKNLTISFANDDYKAISWTTENSIWSLKKLRVDEHYRPVHLEIKMINFMLCGIFNHS